MPALFVASIVVVGISGCFTQVNHSQGPLAVRVVGDAIELAICADVRSAGLSLKVRTGGDWVTAWKASGDASLSRGDVLTEEDVPEIFAEAEVESFEILGSRDLSIVVDAERSTDTIVAAFESKYLDPEGSLWLHPDDTLSAAPCVP